MAKRDINKKTGKIGKTIEKQRRESLEIIFNDMDRKVRAENPPPKIMGNRFIVIEAYKKSHSREEAYRVMYEINQRLGREVYTREMIDDWINKEFGISNTNKKEKEIDDDDDAR